MPRRGNPLPNGAVRVVGTGKNWLVQPRYVLRALVNAVNLSTPAGLLIGVAGRAKLVPGPRGMIIAENYRLKFPVASAFTIGNVVLEKNGRFFTPPVSCGLLAGTFRQQLLDQKLIEEKVILKEELQEYEGIWLINGVRGWLAVELMRNVKPS